MCRQPINLTGGQGVDAVLQGTRSHIIECIPSTPVVILPIDGISVPTCKGKDVDGSFPIDEMMFREVSSVDLDVP
jgi:hypothetical protein